MRDVNPPILWTALLALTAAACEPAPPIPAEPAPAPAPVGWTGGSEGGLAWADVDEARRFALACVSGELRVRAPGLERIGSEDRLTLGVGDEAFALAADLTSPEAGVTASGPVSADLLSRLERGEAISLAYGVQRLGPVPAPDAALTAPFRDACAGTIAQ